MNYPLGLSPMQVAMIKMVRIMLISHHAFPLMKEGVKGILVEAALPNS